MPAFWEIARDMEAGLGRLKKEVKALRVENKELRQDNMQMKETIKLQTPLVEVGVLVRRRFLEQADPNEIPRERVVAAGNAAAHRGNLVADSAMFTLGYMKTLDATACPEHGPSDFEARYIKVWQNMYAFQAEPATFSFRPWILFPNPAEGFDLLETQFSCLTKPRTSNLPSDSFMASFQP